MISKFIEEFNKMDSCLKLEKESGGLARIIPKDPLIMENSKVILSDKFYDEVQRISKELGVRVIMNSMQTTIRIDKE